MLNLYIAYFLGKADWESNPGRRKPLKPSDV